VTYVEKLLRTGINEETLLIDKPWEDNYDSKRLEMRFGRSA
jgi:hypothetical protein